MVVVLLLINGLPASGKSTLVTQIKQYFDPSNSQSNNQSSYRSSSPSNNQAIDRIIVHHIDPDQIYNELIQSNSTSLYQFVSHQNEQSTTHPIEQSNNQSTSQSDGQWTPHRDEQSINQSNNQSNNRSIDQPVEQSTFSPQRWRYSRTLCLQRTDHLIGQLINPTVKQTNIQSATQFNDQSLDPCIDKSIKQSKPANLVLVDDVFYLRSQRHAMFGIANKHGCTFRQVLIDCSIDRLIDRNRSRQQALLRSISQSTRKSSDESNNQSNIHKSISPQLIENLSTKFERATLVWDKSSCLTVDQSIHQLVHQSDDQPPNCLEQSVVKFISDAFDSPSIDRSTDQSVNRALDQQTTASSLTHQLDLELRQSINQHMRSIHQLNNQSTNQTTNQTVDQSINRSSNQSVNRSSTQSIAQSLNQLRRSILADLHDRNSYVYCLIDQSNNQSNNQSTSPPDKQSNVQMIIAHVIDHFHSLIDQTSLIDD